MSKLTNLQAKYPTFPVKSAPLSDCTVCQGTGEFVNAIGKEHVCACTCIAGPDKIRKIMVEVLQGTVEGLVKEAEEKKKDDPIS